VSCLLVQHLYHVFSALQRLALALELCCQSYHYKSYLIQYIKIPIVSIVYQPANKQHFVAKVPVFFLKFGQLMISNLGNLSRVTNQIAISDLLAESCIQQQLNFIAPFIVITLKISHLEHFGLYLPKHPNRLLLTSLYLITWKRTEQKGYSVARSCGNIKTNKLVVTAPPLVGCPWLPVQYICSYPPYWRPFLHPQPEDAPCYGDRDHLVMGTSVYQFK
jgi:hypothetical protein